MLKKSKLKNISIILKNVKALVDFDEGAYSEKEKTDILNIVDTCSKEIFVDKSYIQRNKNSCDDAFLLPEGWEEFKSCFFKSKMFSILSKSSYPDIVNIMTTIAICYITSIVQLFYKDFKGYISLDQNSSFQVYILEDRYDDLFEKIGKWQNWK